MKPNIIISLIVIVLLSSGCSNGTKVGSTFEKSFELVFDSVAVKNNSYLEFEVEKSQDIDLSFSKGEYSNNRYKITAKEYMSDNDPIKIRITTGLAGNYNFEMELINSSNDVDVDYSNKESIVIPNLEFISTWKHYLWLLILGGLVILGLIIGFLINRKRANSFDNGYLQILYPKNEQIELEGKNKIDLVKFLNIEDDVFCTLYCEPDTTFEDEEEIDIKLPRIEIDTDISLKVNDIENISESAYLKDKDSISIINLKGEEIIKLKYNEY